VWEREVADGEMKVQKHDLREGKAQDEDKWEKGKRKEESETGTGSW